MSLKGNKFLWFSSPALKSPAIYLIKDLALYWQVCSFFIDF